MVVVAADVVLAVAAATYTVQPQFAQERSSKGGVGEGGGGSRNREEDNSFE